MVAHRIKQLRKARGLSQEALGHLAGLTKFQVYRLEKGETTLDVPTAEKLARAFAVPIAELLQAKPDELASPPPGFAEELTAFLPAPTDVLASLAGGTFYLFTVNSDALSAAGVQRGDVVRVNDSPDACQNVKPLAIVRVRLHPADNFLKPVSLLRQFVPPRLLITNSAIANAPSLEMGTEDAHIVGVIASVHRSLP